MMMVSSLGARGDGVRAGGREWSRAGAIVHRRRGWKRGAGAVSHTPCPEPGWDKAQTWYSSCRAGSSWAKPPPINRGSIINFSSGPGAALLVQASPV